METGSMWFLCRSRASGSHPLGAAVLADDLREFPRIPAKKTIRQILSLCNNGVKGRLMRLAPDLCTSLSMHQISLRRVHKGLSVVYKGGHR